MNAASGRLRLSTAVGLLLGLVFATASPADEQDRKSSGKGKDQKKVIVLQLDLSKAPPGLIKQLLEVAKTSAPADGKKSSKRDDDDDDDKKKSKSKKKSADKKPNIVQVDLNRLSPELARRLTAELAKMKGTSKKSKKDDDDD